MGGMIERLVDCLEALPDPRDPCKVEHRLIDVLVIAVCAVIGEAESFEDIADYGRCKRAWLAQFLALPNGIPSHDTFRRVLTLVDPDAFERSFLGWVRAVFRPEEDAPRQVAIDGKTVRRSFDRKQGRSPLHLVSAYATEHGLVLAQRAAEEKKGELAVLPDLLEGLDLEGCLVSLDALACHPEVAGRIVGRGGDYLLALKGNRRKAHAEVTAWFAANAFALGAPLRPCFDAFDDGHGRLVRRRVFACSDVGVFTTLTGWPDLKAALAVETIRGIPGRGRVTAEIRHYLSSAKLSPEALAVAIRSHWRIENGLHWVLDVTFREDASRVRERNAGRNLALLRKIALNLARADRTRSASLRRKRKQAAWDDTYMARLIQPDLMR
jgi:predicted transposase YbfD/YdcC